MVYGCNMVVIDPFTSSRPQLWKHLISQHIEPVYCHYSEIDSISNAARLINHNKRTILYSENTMACQSRQWLTDIFCNKFQSHDLSRSTMVHLLEILTTFFNYLHPQLHIYQNIIRADRGQQTFMRCG